MHDDVDDVDEVDGDDDEGHHDVDHVRCSAAALDLAVPADGTLRPLERLDGRWTCMSMPQHVNLIAYGGQFTDATWPSFGLRRRRLRLAAEATAAAGATVAAEVAADVRPAAEPESAVVRAVMRAVQEQAVSAGRDGDGDGGGGGRMGFWRRFLSCLRGLFRLPLLAKRRGRRAPPRFKCTTL